MSAPLFDWNEMARRLEAGAAALAAIDRDDPAVQARLLRERAAALAVPAVPASVEPQAGIEALAFRCGGERYAFDATLVARVLPAQALTAVPGVPAWVAGVTMWEGEVLAVVDLRVLLALPLAELADPSALVVLEGEDNCFAVLADSIDGARRFAPEDMGHCLPALNELANACLLAVAPDRTALLDARRLLADPTLVVDADR